MANRRVISENDEDDVQRAKRRGEQTPTRQTASDVPRDASAERRTGIVWRQDTRMKWLLRVMAALIGCYIALFTTVAAAMLQPPQRFGAFMKHVPPVLVWGGLPAARMWTWARRGRVTVGDVAPDFDLRTALDRTRRVTLASYRGQRPVVLVFGSYT
jgi:hypothetical protein